MRQSQARQYLLARQANRVFKAATGWIQERVAFKMDGTLVQQRNLAIESLEVRRLLAGDLPPLVNLNTTPNSSESAFKSSPGDQIAEVNGVLYLAANDGTHGIELWKSDGTLGGTTRVMDVYPGENGSEIRLINASTHVEILDQLYFSANDGTHGRELWKSDGTEQGTVMIKDINPGIAGNSISSYSSASIGNTLYFAANDGASGRELWKTDGTEIGTVRVKDIRPGPQGSFNGFFSKADGVLYFNADDGVSGIELWRSDGTEAGTFRISDINPNEGSSFPSPITEVSGTIFFVAQNPQTGMELWKTDGTEEGTVLVKDIQQGASSSYPSGLVNMNGSLYFTAQSQSAGRELWKSDGTAEGTVMVKDINQGHTDAEPFGMTNVNGSLFFGVYNGTNGPGLWKSDGSELGTVPVSEGLGIQNSFVNMGDSIFFTADDGTHGAELWSSDGTEEGTVMVMDIADGSASSFPGGSPVLAPSFIVLGNSLLFHAETATYGRELYVLDLTSSQTSIETAFVYHAGSSFANSGVESALDSSKQLAKEGNEPLTLTYGNLINSSRGINGLAFDIQNLPGSPSSSLTAADFEFQMSPTGAFIEAEHSPANWSNAPVPSSISIVAGSEGSPDRVVLEWPDNAIANRWLRITVKATANTGLTQPEVYYIGHLLGETTGASGGVYTVSFADISPIRSAVGQSVDAGSIHDIDKSGTVAFADISAMRSNVGIQLTNITIPASQAAGNPMLMSGPGGKASGVKGEFNQRNALNILVEFDVAYVDPRPTGNWPEVLTGSRSGTDVRDGSRTDGRTDRQFESLETAEKGQPGGLPESCGLTNTAAVGERTSSGFLKRRSVVVSDENVEYVLSELSIETVDQYFEELGRALSPSA